MLQELVFMLPYFFIVGILVGTLSMLFGIGGGLVIVPATDLFLEHMGYPHSLAMKIAVATSLVTIFASTLNVLRKQNKSGYVLWPLVSKFLPYTVAGGLTGSILSHQVSGNFLTYLFIAFLTFVIIQALSNKNFRTPHTLADFREPSLFSRGLMGFIVGNLSILIGVGGNVLLVPYLRYFKLPMKNATAFTVAIMPLLALIGSIGYLVSGLHATDTLPPYSFGYINVPAFALIFAGSFLGAIIGGRILKHLTDKIQARAYLSLLVVILCLMLSSTDLFKFL
jgi:uncharacterized protein